ncbi:LAME_0G09186g1_1 [Lachancea meyersii CBS 8951]|uniref:LAME_0G09186g1_1 n=1 Tax=Lachancea meyersii CBS 8951 TaxID=1266667 RepID=A0A1G4K8H5_9SACH|nr:LAME_0G09186g1_1 [Lachancea meyersii CBS 8951]
MSNEGPRDYRNIALDEEAYARYVCENTIQSMPQTGKIPVLSIPRYSFTAFRLTYASPVEISLSGRSILLGGVPNLWYIQHKNSFLSSLYRFAHKNVSYKAQKAGRKASFMKYRSSRKSRRAGGITARNIRLRKEREQKKQNETDLDFNDLQGVLDLAPSTRQSSRRSSLSSVSDANSITVAAIEEHPRVRHLTSEEASSQQSQHSQQARHSQQAQHSQQSQQSQHFQQSQQFNNSQHFQQSQHSLIISETRSESSAYERPKLDSHHTDDPSKHHRATLNDVRTPFKKELQNDHKAGKTTVKSVSQIALSTRSSFQSSMTSEKYYSADEGYGLTDGEYNLDNERQYAASQQYNSVDEKSSSEDELSNPTHGKCLISNRAGRSNSPSSGLETDTLSDSSPETIKCGQNINAPHFQMGSAQLIQPTVETRKASAVKFEEEQSFKNLRQLSARNATSELDDIDFSDARSSSYPLSSAEEDSTSSTILRGSNRKNGLKLLSATPYVLSRQECADLQALDNNRKMLKEVKNFVSKTGKKIHLDKLDKLHFNVSGVLGRDLAWSQKLFRKYRAGEVIKMEKMLVFVKSSKSARGPLLHFSDVEPIDTRVVERWKEYIVVARATGRPDAPLYLQFYHDRNIPYVDTSNSYNEQFRANSMDFMLDSSCMVDFYNTLDKTIHVIKSSRSSLQESRGTKGQSSEDVGKLKIYIFRCVSFAAAEKWLWFLRRSMGHVNRSQTVTISIPEVEVSLEIPMSTELRHTFDRRGYAEEDDFKVLIMPRGYKPLGLPLARYLEIMILSKLLECGFDMASVGWIQANTITGFCWKHYDRLEWCPGFQYDSVVGGISLLTSHLLEYRTLTHYPRCVKLTPTWTLTEPPGVEGFLMKCTDRYGRETEKVLHTAYYRFLYFFTSDGLLFFMNSFKGLPPLPDEMISKSGPCAYDIDQMKKKITSVPKVFEHNPYPLNLDSHIEWLNEDITPSAFEEKDNAAFAAMWRKIALVLKAEKIIDLTEIKSVFRLNSNNEYKNTLRYKILTRANNFVWKASSSVDDTVNSTIVLSMRNGLEVKLLAPSPESAEEWVSRLGSLSKYWKYRKAEDVKSMWSAKVGNLCTLKIPESEESNISQDTPKWVTDRGVANEEVHNISSQALTRPLMQSGVLYQKRHKHSSFKKFFVILTPGFLILYKYFKSAKVNHSKAVVDHRHYLTIPIEECYVYSGNLTSLDLLQRDKQFDLLNPGNNSLPRVYPDGWRSSEDESTRCFTLWFGTKRAVSNYNSLFKHSGESRPHTAGSMNSTEESDLTESKNRPNTSSSGAGELSMEENLQKKTGAFRLASRLGVAGKSLVFMARSRQERDQWALKIHYELGRLRTNNEDM